MAEDLDDADHGQQCERGEQVAVPGHVDVWPDVATGYPMPKVEIMEVVRDRIPGDRPERHATVNERRRVEAGRQPMRMAELIDPERNEEQGVPEPDSEQPPKPRPPREDHQRDGQQRSEQTAGRVAIRQECERQRDVAAANRE